MKNLRAAILLFLANSISAVAQGISMIAIPWYFALQDEMSSFALLFLGTTIASIFWGAYSGTLVDKKSRKNIFLGLCGVTGGFLFVISGIGYYQGALSLLLVGIVFFITFLNYSLHFPAAYAFAQEIIPKQYYAKMSSFLEISHQVTGIISGALAAILLEGATNGTINIFGFTWVTDWQISPWKIHKIFLVDAITYLLAMGIIALIQYESLVERVPENGSAFARFKIGWEYLKAEKGIRIFGLASFSIFACLLVSHFYLFPTYVKNHLFESGGVYATGDMYYGIGAVFAGIAIRQLFAKMSLTSSIIWMTLISSLLFFALGYFKSLLLYYVILLFLGVTNAGVRIQRVTYLMKKVPNQIYGRVDTLFFLSNIVFRIVFLSLFSIPFFATGNVIYGMYLFGGILLASALILIAYKKLF